MATFLNVEDFDLILSERDTMRRAGLACRLYADYEAGALNAGEVRAALSIFRALVRDSDVEVRARFARFVASSAVLSSDIALRMAGDVRAVAAPVVAGSPALTEAMLVDLAASPDAWRQIAIARRKTVSRAVAAALVEVGCAQACHVLLVNPGTMLPGSAFDRLSERFRDHHGLREAMLARPGAPSVLIENHLSAVADRLSRFVTTAGWLDSRTARLSAGSAVDQALIGYASARAPEVLQELVARWAREERINAVFLLRAAISGSNGVFEHSVAALARLPAARIRALLRDRAGYGLRSLCARMGLDRSVETDLMRVRLARARVVDRDPRAPDLASARAIAGLVYDPEFAPQHALSPMAAAVVRDIVRAARAPDRKTGTAALRTAA